MRDLMDSVPVVASIPSGTSASTIEADSPPLIPVVVINEDFAIVDKPAGMTVQRDDTHGQGVLEILGRQLGGPVWPVHRLDAGTSGLLIVARTEAANRELSRLFRERLVQKAYLAVSKRSPSRKQGWIKGDMLPARRGAWKLAMTQQNPAITRFFSRGLGGRRLFLVFPRTGKTHQIRVALKSLGAPISGDRLYGGDEAERLFLHAGGVRFPWAGTMIDAWSWPPAVGEFLAIVDLATQAWVRDTVALVQGPPQEAAPRSDSGD